jgi:hypothetical protein
MIFSLVNCEVSHCHSEPKRSGGEESRSQVLCEILRHFSKSAFASQNDGPSIRH